MALTKNKKSLNRMYEHWDSNDVFDDVVNHFGKTNEIINFCSCVEKKLNEALANLPKYLEMKIGK